MMSSFGIATVRYMTSFMRPWRCAASSAMTRSAADEGSAREVRSLSEAIRIGKMVGCVTAVVQRIRAEDRQPTPACSQQ
jgi:hypothetical protein